MSSTNTGLWQKLTENLKGHCMRVPPCAIKCLRESLGILESSFFIEGVQWNHGDWSKKCGTTWRCYWHWFKRRGKRRKSGAGTDRWVGQYKVLEEFFWADLSWLSGRARGPTPTSTLWISAHINSQNSFWKAVTCSAKLGRYLRIFTMKTTKLKTFFWLFVILE